MYLNVALPILPQEASEMQQLFVNLRGMISVALKMTGLSVSRVVGWASRPLMHIVLLRSIESGVLVLPVCQA